MPTFGNSVWNGWPELPWSLPCIAFTKRFAHVENEFVPVCPVWAVRTLA